MAIYTNFVTGPIKEVKDIISIAYVGDKYSGLASVYLTGVFDADPSLERRNIYELSRKETKLVEEFEIAYKELRVFYAWIGYYLADSYYDKSGIASNLNRMSALTVLQELDISDTTVPPEIKKWVDEKYGKSVEFFPLQDTNKILNTLNSLQDGHNIIINGML